MTWIQEATQPLQIKRWGPYQLEINQMIVNARLVMSHDDNPWEYDYAWCYRDIATAAVAAYAWNPDTDDEPPGWHKRSGRRLRVAPNRTADTQYRCDHGTYPDNTCPHIGCEGTP